jgi:integrase
VSEAAEGHGLEGIRGIRRNVFGKRFSRHQQRWGPGPWCENSGVCEARGVRSELRTIAKFGWLEKPPDWLHTPEFREYVRGALSIGSPDLGSRTREFEFYPHVVDSAPVTPFPASTGASVPRRRFQEGSLVQRSGRWYGVYRVDVLQSDGRFKREQCWQPLGLVKEQSERNAKKQFQPYLNGVNEEAQRLPPKTGLTLADLVREWRVNVAVNLKSSTVRAVESHLRAHNIPKLGNYRLQEITTNRAGFVAHLAAGKRSRKTVENVLLTLSSLLKTARSWGYACGDFRFADLTLPREGVRTETRCFTDEEMRAIIANAPEPLSTIVAVTAVLGLRIGETLGLRIQDVDFTKRVVRVRQSVDAASRTVCGVKSKASSADLPMPKELEVRLRTQIHARDRESELLFVNRRSRPLSANKLREKQLHPLLDAIGIARGGFHSMRHGAASALLADGVTPAVVQKQLRHSDARITLGIYGRVVGDAQRNAVQNRSTKLVN